MSFSLTVPRSVGGESFEDAVIAAKATPKIDARTKIGKCQNMLVEAAKGALIEMAWGFDPPLAGTISGHVNPDLSASVSIGLQLLVPLPEPAEE